MGDTYGLAKKATAIAVKALNDFGGGSSAYVHCYDIVMTLILVHVSCMITINSFSIHTVV